MTDRLVVDMPGAERWCWAILHREFPDANSAHWEVCGNERPCGEHDDPLWVHERPENKETT